MKLKEFLQRTPYRSAQEPADALREKTPQETVLNLSKSQEQAQRLLGLLSEALKTYQQEEDLSIVMGRIQRVLKDEAAECPSLPSGEEGFMCATDFDWELGSAKGGIPVYSSLKDLQENRSCIRQCGVARVRVVLMEWVQHPDFSILFSQAVARRIALGQPKTEDLRGASRQDPQVQDRPLG